MEQLTVKDDQQFWCETLRNLGWPSMAAIAARVDLGYKSQPDNMTIAVRRSARSVRQNRRPADVPEPHHTVPFNEDDYRSLNGPS